MAAGGRPWQELARYPAGARPVPALSRHALALTGEQTKALVTQLTLFNQILVELRDDIRDQVRGGQRRGRRRGRVAEAER